MTLSARLNSGRRFLVPRNDMLASALPPVGGSGGARPDWAADCLCTVVENARAAGYVLTGSTALLARQAHGHICAYEGITRTKGVMVVVTKLLAGLGRLLRICGVVLLPTMNQLIY
jgi:hypothetical protein